jgi:hypothetical protein
MTTIDKQRIAAIRKLEQLGYTFEDVGSAQCSPRHPPRATRNVCW